MTDQIRQLEARMNRLERANRALIAAAVGVAAIAAWSCADSGAQPPRADARLRRLEVVDGEGNVRALLTADKEGGLIALNDASGKPRVSITASGAGSGVEIFGEGENGTRCALSLEPGGSSLEFTDDKGARRVSVGFFKDTGWLALFDPAGNVAKKVTID